MAQLVTNIPLSTAAPPNSSNNYNATLVKERFFCSFIYKESITGEPATSLGDMDSIETLCDAAKLIRDICLWLGLVTGLPGNIIALITILLMPRTTTTLYIALLAFLDAATVAVQSTVSFLADYKVHRSPWDCKATYLLMNYFGTYANWVLVLICFERFVSIRFPLKKNYYFTVRRAYLSAIILGVILLPVGLTYIWIIHAHETGVCMLTSEYAEFTDAIWSHIVNCMYAFIPVALVFIMTALIVSEMRKIRKTRKDLMYTGLSPVHNNANGRHHEEQNSCMQRQMRDIARMERSITIMMVFTAIVFMLMVLPICVIMALPESYDASLGPLPKARYMLWAKIAQSLRFLSHAVNFYLYFVTNRKFRSQLWRTLTCRKRSNRNGGSTMGRSVTQKSTV